MLYSTRSVGYTFFAVTLGIAGTAMLETDAVAPGPPSSSAPVFVIPFESGPTARAPQAWARLLGVVELDWPHGVSDSDATLRPTPEDGAIER